ncbi:hypothetical protein [Aquabacterium sp. OR-4]|uniref:hypothetical protein n=1 Tax=Aquabacterium sp. OR-4 TaxID=2978127 RepID=UPI0021B1993C|nr:hypothetical protein [Aquabacterium sp. OR-4]MDT7834056.1 hypothetical protein [Aquabacterium sp. OR-4]
MRSVLPSPLLRGALVLDAVVSAASGLLQLALGATAAAWLGLPLALLTETGVFMLVYAAVLALLARSRGLAVPLVQGVVGANLLWAAASLAIVLAGPSLGLAGIRTLGTVWLLMNLASVSLFAALQLAGLQRSAPAPAQPGLARS